MEANAPIMCSPAGIVAPSPKMVSPTIGQEHSELSKLVMAQSSIKSWEAKYKRYRGEGGKNKYALSFLSNRTLWIQSCVQPSFMLAIGNVTNF